MSSAPILLVGAGHMGGALVTGWRLAGAFSPSDLMVLDPQPGPAVAAAREAGARLNPPEREFAGAATVVMAVTPQIWRAVAAEIEPHLAADAVVVSTLAGVGVADLAEAFGGRGVARVMPTMAAAIGKGAAAVHARDARARRHAHDLFEPLGLVVDLEDEASMHAATAVCGSAPAYLYAFIEALGAAAAAAGLEPADAARLPRAAIIGAAALLDQTGEDAADLRRQVTSPGGTTEAALEVLLGDGGLGPLLEAAVAAAMARSRDLGAPR